MSAAPEVAPRALTLCLLCGEKMHEDCEGIAGILPLTGLSCMVKETIRLLSKAILLEAENPNHPTQCHERKRERKKEGGTGRGYTLPWPLRLGFV